jgi:hypothetical protein
MMQYQTMSLELLKQRPQLHDRLRQERKLLTAMETLALHLKARHEAWKEQLAQAKPGSDPQQIASEALEIALQETQDSLPAALRNEDEELSLDQAMAHLLRPTPPA